MVVRSFRPMTFKYVNFVYQSWLGSVVLNLSAALTTMRAGEVVRSCVLSRRGSSVCSATTFLQSLGLVAQTLQHDSDLALRRIKRPRRPSNATNNRLSCRLGGGSTMTGAPRPREADGSYRRLTGPSPGFRSGKRRISRTCIPASPTSTGRMWLALLRCCPPLWCPAR